MARVKAENIFVTRIKTNTVYENIEEKERPDNKVQDILKDEIVRLCLKKAIEIGIAEQQMRKTDVFKEDEDKVIEIITNQLNWSARTIVDLYKKRWDIELFYKAMKKIFKSKHF